MIIILQQTVDCIFAIDPKNATTYFQSLGIPEVKETESGIKYYVFKSKED
jgi:hypothetical protein